VLYVLAGATSGVVSNRCAAVVFLLTSALFNNIKKNFSKYRPLATCFGGGSERLSEVLFPFSMTGDWNEHN
jgi:hypothetical protein